MDITERILRALSHQRIIEPEWGTEEIEITEADWQFIGERYQQNDLRFGIDTCCWIVLRRKVLLLC